MPVDALRALAPDHVLLGTVVALLLVDMLRLRPSWARGVYALGVAAALAATARQFGDALPATVVAGEIVVDRYALAGKAVVLAGGLALAAAFPREGGAKFWALVASSLLGAAVILDSAGFATLFLGIELLSLPAFALIVHGAGAGTAAEGAFKYLVLSSVASALVLFGVSLAYGLTGSLAIAPFAAALSGGGPQALAAGVLVLSGLFLKAAVFPFHAWAPDAYAAARLPVTAMLAAIVKGAVVLALVRVVGTAPLSPAVSGTVAVLALLSIAFGNLAALPQRSFRRLLAYSSVAHAGYMVVALLDTTGRRPDDLLWYVALYALGTLVAAAAYARLCPGDDDRLERLAGAFARRPGAALALGFGVLSLAGLPPFPGFFAKLLVFGSVVASGQVAIAVAAFAGSFLGLAYYVGIVLRLFAADAQNEPSPARGAAP